MSFTVYLYFQKKNLIFRFIDFSLLIYCFIFIDAYSLFSLDYFRLNLLFFKVKNIILS